MKIHEAEKLKTKFVSLILKPTAGSIIVKILVSYMEESVANEHFRNIEFGVPGIPQVAAYEND